jgi:hypothetical protein
MLNAPIGDTPGSATAWIPCGASTQTTFAVALPAGAVDEFDIETTTDTLVTTTIGEGLSLAAPELVVGELQPAVSPLGGAARSSQAFFYRAVRVLAGTAGVSIGVSYSSQPADAPRGALFTYRESDPNPVGPIYPDWASAWVAASSVSSLPSELHVDDSVAPLVVPAGAWDLSDIKLSGRTTFPVGGPQPVAGTTLPITTGATLPNLGEVEGVTVESHSSGAVTTLGPGTHLVSLGALAALHSVGGSGPVLHLLAGAALELSMDGLVTSIAGTAGHPAILVDLGAGVSVSAQASANVGAYAFGGAGDVEIGFVPGVSIDPNAGTDVTGIFALVPAAAASQVGYTPAVPGNWSPTPTTVAGALDQLAKKATLFALDVTLVAGTNGNVTVTSYTAAAAVAGTDASTYTVTFENVS